MNEFDRRSSEPARAAWLYYAEELTQSQVADKLGVSRSTVIRLLRRAKESGLVQISLGVSSETFATERDLEDKYGLKKARIVPVAETEEMQRRWLGQVAGEALIEMVKSNSTVAVSWGRTMLAMADSLTGEAPTSNMEIVALIGGLHNASRGTNPYEVAEQLGKYFGAPARALYAPVYVKNAATAEGLRDDPGLSEALDLARNADLVAFSIGALSDDATMLSLGYVNPEERDFLAARGAVGDIACRWVDSNGAEVEMPDTIHPIGISLSSLRKIPDRLAVAGGPDKIDVLRASLVGGYVTHLITDEASAATLLSS
ncbi:sugar-binding transcriptional regulator [Palleronia sediminis]|nr:sugar-binding transcriptional regulator [Palleronia sediminis]